MTCSHPDIPFTQFDDIAYGKSIQVEQIVEDILLFDAWEERYKYIIALGQALPPWPAHYHTDEAQLHGCQSQVWLHYYYHSESNKLCFFMDSDALIVKGLIAFALSILNHKSPEAIMACDITTYFDQINLTKHLTVSRTNGLHVIISGMKKIALGLTKTPQTPQTPHP